MMSRIKFITLAVLLVLFPISVSAHTNGSNGKDLKILIKKAYVQRKSLLRDITSNNRNIHVPQSETLFYTITYSNLLNAGKAVLSERPGLYGKKKVIILRAKAKSAGWISFFYFVNDNTESFFSLKKLYPYMQIMFRHEGDHNDFMQEKLNMSAKEEEKIIGKLKNKKNIKLFDKFKNYDAIALMKDKVNTPFKEYLSYKDTQDSLSAMYYLRMFRLEKGKTYYIPVFNHTKRYIVLIKAMGYYDITTPAGKFFCIKLRAFLNFNGIFVHKGAIDIYVSEGPLHTPVYLKADIPIGFVSAILEKREN